MKMSEIEDREREMPPHPVDAREEHPCDRLLIEHAWLREEPPHRRGQVEVEPLAAELTQRLARPVIVANDADCFALSEATDGAAILPGHIYLAPGGPAHLEVHGTATPRCRLSEGETVNGHRPSVDVLFQSVCRTYGRRAVGVILTGMGRDGAAGLKAMRDSGASTIGQDEASCVVYGMPKVAFEMGAVQRQLPLSAIARAALDLCALEIRGAA